MNIIKVNENLINTYGGRFRAFYDRKLNRIVVKGKSADWNEVVEVCRSCVDPDNFKSGIHVVNDIVFTGGEDKPVRIPSVTDKSLDGAAPDVLIIGGGISGASIARELSKWKLDILLVDKESDLAMQASGRNDGEVHPGIDLGKGTLKHKFVRAGNAMYTQVCDELGVPFERVGQYVCFNKEYLKPVIAAYCALRKHRDGISDTTLISGEELKRREPNLNGDFKFAISNPDSGCVCPYGLTIAYAENAVMNGAKVSLDTAVLSVKTENGKIVSVETNRGTVYPKIVVNAAGVFGEAIADMAGDRFFSIHPRRGTNSILDRKAGAYMHSIASVKELTAGNSSHSKGGGILHTVHGNLLAGPDAVETYEKENVQTHRESIETVFNKQTVTMPKLSQRDIITYFTGVRAPTFEEDFVLEKGRAVENLIHCAGIQSPGLTTAPAVALYIEELVTDELKKSMTVERNPSYNPRRKPIPHLKDMSDSERDALIKENPDYGVIICRCEEISKGEILDALRSPICVPTVDGIKKRVRPGMGRCQGGFCSPLVTSIIAEFTGRELSDVRKSSENSVITYGRTK